MYNKKVLGEAVKKLDSAKAPIKKQDTIYNPKEEGMILDLSPEEIEEYRKGGYIIEDISVPSLNHMDEGGEPCPEGFQEDPVTGECIKIQDVQEVPTNQYSKYIAEYESANPKGSYVYQKKADYLRKNKNLNRMAGLSQDNFPEDVESNFNKNWEYDKNSAVIEKFAKDNGINPKNHVELVEKMADKGSISYDMIANSKFGSKLKPSLWNRSLAGAQELGNFIVKQLPGEQGDVFNKQIKGLTKKENADIHNSKLGALEALAIADLPGAVVMNAIRDVSTASGGNYQVSPGILTGELKSNVSEGQAALANPFLYTGIGDLAVLGAKGIKLAGAGLKGIKNLPKFLGTESGLLSNAYKLNPQAIKLSEYNRIAGPNAIADINQSGLIRAGEYGTSGRPTLFPSFGKGIPDKNNVYAQRIINQGKTPYIISTDRAMNASTLGRHGKGFTQFPIDESGNYMKSFLANEAKVYDFKPHWRKGYQEVPIELPGSPNTLAVTEPFEIAAKRITNLSRNNTNRIIRKADDVVPEKPAYVQQEFNFPTEAPVTPRPVGTRLQLNPTVPKIEVPTPSARLTNEQKIMEGMEEARLASEQRSLATQQANALKASAEVPKTYPIGNPDYYTYLLSMTKMPAADRKFYTSVVETVKEQGNIASDFQKNMLERIKIGDFKYSGEKGNINAGVSPELIANTAGSKNVVGGKLANFMTDWGLPIGSMFNSAFDVGSPVGSLGSKFLSKISPLNFIPKYGEKIEGATVSIGDILASGVKNGKVSVPKSLFKQAKNIIKKSDDEILTVKNNKTNSDIYTVKVDPNVKGTKVKVSDVPEKQGLLSRKKNASFKVTNKKNVPLTEIKLEDPGVIVYRKLPFSNRYAVVDKAKLIEGKNQWATTGASAQKFAESYGKGLLITGAGGALLWAAEPSEETKKEEQDKWVKDEQTKAYNNAVKQHEAQVENEKKLKYEEHKANITKLITGAIEQGNSQEKIISDLHSTGISAEELIQIYIDNGVPKEEAEDYINSILRNDIFN